jgi:hypothetical protein
LYSGGRAHLALGSNLLVYRAGPGEREAASQNVHFACLAMAGAPLYERSGQADPF